MNLREAAQQALEALEGDCGGRCNAEYNPCAAREAIDALRAVIAEASMQKLTEVQQEIEQEPVAYMAGYHDGYAVVTPTEPVVLPTGMALYTRPPRRETEQPQVVYRLAETDIFDFAGWLTLRPGVMRVGSCCEAGPMAEAVGEYLRTFPERFTPRREWVGLTNKDIIEMWPETSTVGWDDIRIIEAKLKEKNS